MPCFLYRSAAPCSSQRRFLQQADTEELVISRFYPSESKVESTPGKHMMSQHPRRTLPRGNPRKGKHAEVEKPASPKAAEPTPSNRLLAGYLAHEFLTRGTLLGRKFELDSAGIGLGGSTSAEPNRSQLNSQADASAVEHGSYEVVASILKTDGAHIKGVVNPTQLSNWINK